MQNIEYVCSVLENPIFTEGHTIQLESSLRKSEILGYNTASSENEYAVALMNGIVRWMMVKGAESYVYSALFDNASIVAHYHPPMTIAGALPDCRDVGLAATSMSRELIIHNDGLTRYTGVKRHPVHGYLWAPEPEQVAMTFLHYLTLQSYSTFDEYMAVYRQFLHDAGCEFYFYPWGNLPEESPLEMAAEWV